MRTVLYRVLFHYFERFLFGRSYEGIYDTSRDLGACARCFFMLLQAGHFPVD
jgi:hypothetical protein